MRSRKSGPSIGNRGWNPPDQEGGGGGGVREKMALGRLFARATMRK